jgi:subtilisin family serine protease
MKRFRLPLFLLGVLSLAVLLLIARRAPVPSPAAGEGGVKPSTAPAASTPQPEPRPPAAREEASHTRESALANLLAGAKVLEKREIPDPARPGEWRRSQVIETGFKYPVLQIDEAWQRLPDGRERRIAQTAHVADHAIMRFPSGFDRDAVEAWCTRRGLTLRKKLATDDIFLVQASSPVLDAVATLIRNFSNDFAGQELAIAEPDYLQFAEVTPSDPSFGSLWGLHNTGQSSGTADADIDAAEAWSLSTGSRDVIVGVIDTGIDGGHPDLAPNMWTNPAEIAGNGIDDDGNGFVDDTRGWDFYADDADPSDVQGHGTHCAGTIGAAGDNLTGVAGVNWEVSLVSLRFLGDGGGGTTSDAIDAVNYACGLGITLTSNSWGGGGYSSTLEQAIRNAGNAGQLFIAAAGNDATNNDFVPHYPSSYPLENVIAVASTTRTDALSSFSCYGALSVDLAAPGSDILSTTMGGTYGTKSGTSMATPHVAGTAALLYAISPGRSHVDIKNVLLQTADPLPVLNGICVSGGRLNAYRAAEYVAGPRVLPTVVSLVELEGNGDGIASPGELVAIDARFKNIGSEPSDPGTVSLSLATAVAGATITGSPFPLEYLDPGQTSPVFRFTLALDPLLDTPRVLELEYRATTETGQTWSEKRKLPVNTICIIRGRVQRLDGLGPLADATVSYTGPVIGSVTTGPQGEFDLFTLDGSYTLQASALGFMPGSPVEVTVPPDASGLDLLLGVAAVQPSPAALTLTLPAGDSTLRTIQISNPGNLPVDWEAISNVILPQVPPAAAPLATPPSGDPDRPDAPAVRDSFPPIRDFGQDLRGVGIGLITASSEVFNDDMRARGATLVQLASPLNTDVLKGLKLIVVEDSIASLSLADITLLREWIMNGGAILLGADNSSSMSHVNALLADSGIQEIAFPNFETVVLDDILTHEITEGVTSLRAASYGSHCILSEAAEPLVRYASGQVFAAVSHLGSGRVLACGNEMTYSGDWAANENRLFVNQAVAWLSGPGWLTVEDPASGTLAPGATASVTVRIDASFLEAGLHQGRLILKPSEGATSAEIPVELTVTDAAAITFDPPQLEFPETLAGTEVTRNVTIVNPGTLELSLSSLTINHPVFSFASPAPLILAPHERRSVPVTFRPETVELHETQLTAISDDPTNPQAGIPVRGRGISGPLLSHSPPAISVSLPHGEQRSEALTLFNQGDTSLEWSVDLTDTKFGLVPLADPLTALLERLERGSERVTGLIPSRHDFEDGITGYSIYDGGANMYGYGNYLTTETSSGDYIDYSDGVVVSDAPEMGGGRYFTRKYPGLFVFAGELGGISSFRISGSTGTQGQGKAEGAEFVVQDRGKTYRGFFKRVFGAASPSINQLIIVEDIPGISRTFPISTYDDGHVVSGLPARGLLHYLLFSRKAGGKVDDETALSIMRTYLRMADGALPWATATPVSGSIPPGSSRTVVVNFDSREVPPGNQGAILSIRHNQHERVSVAVPLIMEVTPAAFLQVSAEAMLFPPTATGSTSRLLLSLRNAGSVPMTVMPSLEEGISAFSLAESGGILLGAGESRNLAVDFSPNSTGVHEEILSIDPGISGQAPRQVSLQGSGIPAGPLVASPRSLNFSLASGSTGNSALTLRNPSGPAVAWIAEPTASGGDTPGERLKDLNVQIIGSSSGAYDDFSARLRSEGAGVAFGYYYDFDPASLKDLDLVLIDAAVRDLGTVEIAALKQWVNSGGALLIAHAGNSHLNANNLIAGSGITYITPSIPGPVTASFLPHAATRGVTSMPGIYAGSRLTVTAPAVPIAIASDLAIGAAAPVGSGRVICFTDDVFVDQTTVGNIHKDLALQTSRWVSRRLIDWLRITPESGTAEAGSNTELTVTADATGLAAGIHDADIRLSSGNPPQTFVVPVRLTVSGIPQIVINPEALALPETFGGAFVEKSFSIENRGAAPLVIASIQSSDPELGLAGDFPLIVPPFKATTLHVRYEPASASGPLAATLTLHSNDPARPQATMTVTGSANPPPEAAIATELPLKFTIPSGNSVAATFPLANTGGSTLAWSSPLLSGTSSSFVSDVIYQLDANKASVLAAIPHRERFEEGLEGNMIQDRGSNLFDGGNMISTDLAEHVLLSYSDGVLVDAPGALGKSGRYITRKYSEGLFVFAADMKNVSEFRIRGDLGADGAGIAEGMSILLARRDTAYRGFLKQVHGSGMRTLNQLVIVEDKPGLAHDFATDTGDGSHTITGLAANTRLYYLLFVGKEGAVIDETGAKGVMSAFLDSVMGTLSIGYTSLRNGTVAAGGTVSTGMTSSASGLNAGIYKSNIPLFTNDPLRPVALVPVELTVTGTPSIQLSKTTAVFGSIIAGAQATPITFTVTNTGKDVLTTSAITVDPPFSVTPAENFSLAPGAQKTLGLGFAPTEVANYNGKIRISSNAVNLPDAEVALSGTASPPPVPAASAGSFEISLQGGSTANRSLTLSNTGAGNLGWSATVDYAFHEAAGGQDLSGVRIGLFTAQESLMRTFVDRLRARGASVTTLVHALSPDPSPYDLLVVDGQLEAMNSTYVNTLRNWVLNGGSLLTVNTSSVFTKLNTLLAGSGLTAATFSSYVSMYNFTLTSHPVTTGVSYLDEGAGFPNVGMQLNATAPATVLVKGVVNSGTPPNLIALAPQGKGWIMSSNISYFDLFALVFGGVNNERFTDQSVSWLTGRLRTWITPTPASGTVLPGNSSTLSYAINAAGMLPGTYRATIKIATNSPSQPVISIPVTLVVPAESGLLANKTSLTFADTKVGQSSTLSISVRIDHKGTLPVTISSIQLPPAFPISNLTLPQTLRNGGSVTFSVRFSPMAAGFHGGQIEFISDAAAPPAAIPVSGTGLLGPVLEYSAPSLELARFPNAVSELPLQISNSGVENLIWNASALNPSPPGTPAPVLGGLRVGLFTNNHGSFSGKLATWGAEVTQLPTTSALLSPQPFDTIVIDGRMTSLVTSHFTALREWVKSGGILILEGGTYSSVSRLNSLIKDSGLSAAHHPIQTAEVTNFSTHPLTQGITTLSATDCEIALSANGAGTILARLPDGTGFAGLGKLGKGTIFALGQQVFSDGRYTAGNASLLSANSLSLLQAGRDAAWLTTTTSGGTLVPGAGDSFSIVVNPTALPPGNYRRQLQLTSNDPLRAKVLLTADLSVIAPWTISPSPVDFGEVVSGDLATRMITISGANPDPIPVSPGFLAPGPFSVHVPASPAVSGDQALELPLTYHPAADGPAAATLRLETSAGLLEVPLSGTGVPAGEFPLGDFALWRGQHFPGAGPFTGMSDDSDGDGLDLATEYAFLRDPHVPDGTHPLRIVGSTPSGLRLRYIRRSSFPDSAFPLEALQGSGGWSPFEPAGRTITVNPDGSTTVEFGLPYDGQSKRFLRGTVGTR